MTDSQFEDFLAIMYESVASERSWTAFLVELQKWLNASGSGLISKRTDGENNEIILFHDGSLAARWSEQNYLEKGYKVDNIHYDQMELNRIYTIDDIPCDGGFRHTELFEQVLKPEDYCFPLWVNFGNSYGFMTLLFAARTPEQGDFSQKDKDFIKRLMPHLSIAAKLWSKLVRSRLEQEIYADATTRFGIGVVIIDSKSRVLGINGAGRRILEVGQDILIEDGKLVFSDSSRKAQLNSLLRKIDSDRGHPLTDVMRIGRSDNAWLGILMRSWIPLKDILHPARPCLILYMNDLHAAEMTPNRMLAELLGLSWSEAALAIELANGLTLIEAAAKMAIAENTARAYSKRIYAKTGLKGQHDLVRFVLKSMAVLTND